MLGHIGLDCVLEVYMLGHIGLDCVLYIVLGEDYVQVHFGGGRTGKTPHDTSTMKMLAISAPCVLGAAMMVLAQQSRDPPPGDLI